MYVVSEAFTRAMVAPVRQFKANVLIRQNENDLLDTTLFTQDDLIKSIEIQRVGDKSKFYGYGICQRLNIHLVDLADEIAPVSNSAINIQLGIVLPDGTTEFVNYPTFYLTEKNRAEEDGELSLTAYDLLDKASQHLITELNLEAPYTIEDVAVSCANFLGVGLTLQDISSDDYAFNLDYEEGANWSGTENIRQVLDRVAEATQTIYYIDFNNNIRFKRLDIGGNTIATSDGEVLLTSDGETLSSGGGEALATITENDYFSFNHGDNRRLVEVCHVTELGDNVSASLGITGTTQYIRNNPFWDLRDDIATIVENALANVAGLTINQFDCHWRGNLPLEIGDKIDLKQVCTDNCVESAYVLDDVITYDGGYSQKTQWKYENSVSETDSNPTSIGEALGDTFAKVDKINREITLYASQITENQSDISQIKMETDEIKASVTNVETTVDEGLAGVNEQIEKLTKEVEATMTAEGVQIAIKSALENGVEKVETSTGYVLDDTGLTISKSDSEISTQITEDGMTVSKSGDVVLVADNQGVFAQNLHATTYLIIGTYSRFEDYENLDGEARTGCFWIGG